MKIFLYFLDTDNKISFIRHVNSNTYSSRLITENRRGIKATVFLQKRSVCVISIVGIRLPSYPPKNWKCISLCNDCKNRFVKNGHRTSASFCI